jgi:hypothetical protein
MEGNYRPIAALYLFYDTRRTVGDLLILSTVTCLRAERFPHKRHALFAGLS